MNGTYTIKRLADAAGVPTSTVRYYEQRGLMKADMRTAANYRVYGSDSLLRLRFIRSAKASGFTLDDIGMLLRMKEGAADVCGSVKHLVEDRLARIEDDLAELRRVRKVLRSTVAWCESPRVKGRCEVLDDLDAQSAGARPTAGRRKRRS